MNVTTLTNGTFANATLAFANTTLYVANATQPNSPDYSSGATVAFVFLGLGAALACWCCSGRCERASDVVRNQTLTGVQIR